MTRILAIDPGHTQSALLVLDRRGDPERFYIDPNDAVLDTLRTGLFDLNIDCVVIEKIASYGMAVGAEVFETVHWAGRFTEAAHPVEVVQLPRLAVKMNLCHDSKAKDANIRQALIDRFGGPESIRKGGVLYKVSKDVWAALGVAVTYADSLVPPVTPETSIERFDRVVSA